MKESEPAAAKPLEIQNVEVINEGGKDRLQATIDGKAIWFVVDASLGIKPRLEPFLPTAILLGMAEGRNIVADPSAPISPKLLKSMETFQRVIRQWNPETFTISIEARTELPEVRSNIVASTYSGGVDSACTLVRRMDEITHLVFLSDFDRHSKDEWPSVEEEWRNRIHNLGKIPLMVETNAVRFTEGFGISSHYSHGSILGGTLAFISPKRGFIPGSLNYRDLKPWGSHPLLDILWSTETTEIVHDSLDLTRSEKIAVLADHPQTLSQLQVCWYARTDNCGRCGKCVRTMLALKLLGGLRGPFPDRDITKEIEKLKPSNFATAGLTWDLLQQARRYGHPEIAKILARQLRAYKIDRDFRSFIKSFIGKSTATRFNRWRGRPWASTKLPLGDPDDFE
nr:B348 [uncultured bacterium]